MIYYPAIIAAISSMYKKCPKCNKRQLFKGKKKGARVTCKKCKYKFYLK